MRRRAPISLILGAALGLTGLTAGMAVASIPDSAGTIHGCYATRTGALRVIDAPAQQCTSKEVAISWAQEGPAGPPIEALDGVPCDTPNGPGTVATRRATTPTQFGQEVGYQLTLACVPDGAYIRLDIYGIGNITAAPAPAHGSDTCVGDNSAGDPVRCVLFYPAGTSVLLTAVPADGYRIHEASWAGMESCAPGAATCQVTVSEPGVAGLVGFEPIP